ncbi:polysaccharide biosynthesis/export family protein [Aquimarina aquimarini]|uniref:polysaccharide biosynthesis/export family protein n=1 Tax=Aquimarina aquimarini TaxID=1191734 RepID=UPI000D560A42|nr:polysaccharide biosynthesis/export family protein [Aquimarina aquimarini]
MIIKIVRTLFLYSTVILLTSCASKKDIVYFQDITNAYEKEVKVQYKTIFEPDDLLSITVSSSDMQGLEPFNLPAVSINTMPGSVVGERKQLTYLIKNDGAIDFPVLGKVKLEGLSLIQATNVLKEKLSNYIKDPIVHIELVNFKITVLGEVNKPGTFTIPNERISIIEALGLAGDLTITGKRKDILVIREQDGKYKYHRIDITSDQVFNSPVFYLKQNDAIYVTPNKAKIKSSSYNKNTPIWVSVASVLLSVVILLTR